MSDGDHYDPIRKSHEGANASVDGYALPISDTRQADWQPDMLYTHFRYFFGMQTPSKMVLEH